MKLLALSAAVGLTTAIMPRAPAAPAGYCCFTLTATNPLLGSAVVEEDTIGQNRVFSSYPDGYYCIDPTQPGKLYDSIGHTCVIYADSKQFQCTLGLQSPVVFTLSDNGDFLADGSNDFWACPSTGPGFDGSYLIFAEAKPDTTGCLAITLDSTGNACTGSPTTASLNAANSTVSPVAAVISGTSPVTSSFSTSVSSVADFSILPISISTTSSAAAQETLATPLAPKCPQDLSGEFLAPNLIIPVSPEAPDIAYGTQHTATITPSNSTLFSFDIPPSWTGMCSLLFTFPYASETAFPGAFRFTGVEHELERNGGLNFDLLSEPVDTAVTWGSRPEIAESYGKTAIIPGNAYTIATTECASGQRLAYEASSVSDLMLEYFQSTGPKPIGLWIVKC